MSIGFVIVTYESERVLPACLASIPKAHEIAVVDNASKDSSAEIAHTFGARLIVNRSNLGFGAACNQGAKLLSSSHVFFLNPDAILDENTIPELEKAMALWPDAGGFGPAIGIPGKRQKFRSVSFPESRGRGFAQEVAPNGSAEAGFLDGAALVVDLKLYWELGGFDERIFLYYEDDDLCFRIRERNKKLIFVPSARVTHARNEFVRKQPLSRLFPFVSRRQVKNIHVQQIWYSIQIRIRETARLYSAIAVARRLEREKSGEVAWRAIRMALRADRPAGRIGSAVQDGVQEIGGERDQKAR